MAREIVAPLALPFRHQLALKRNRLGVRFERLLAPPKLLQVLAEIREPTREMVALLALPFRYQLAPKHNRLCVRFERLRVCFERLLAPPKFLQVPAEIE